MTKNYQQIAALPYILENHRPKYLLITSRRSQRWIIPKGWPKEGMDDHEIAKLEAYEEAGIGGQIGTGSLGYYNELKKHSGQVESEHLRIRVFPLLVTYHYTDWPEKGQRNHTWLRTRQAAKLIENEELAAIISAFDPPARLSNDFKL